MTFIIESVHLIHQSSIIQITKSLEDHVTKYKLGCLIFNIKAIRRINGIRVADRHGVSSILSIPVPVDSTSDLSILIPFFTYYFLP